MIRILCLIVRKLIGPRLPGLILQIVNYSLRSAFRNPSSHVHHGLGRQSGYLFANINKDELYELLDTMDADVGRVVA